MRRLLLAAAMGLLILQRAPAIAQRGADEVIWAMCTRCDPAEDIDFIRRHCWASFRQW